MSLTDLPIPLGKPDFSHHGSGEWCDLLSQSLSQFVMGVAALPLCGYGKFTSMTLGAGNPVTSPSQTPPSAGTLNPNWFTEQPGQLWPQVYQTITESWNAGAYKIVTTFNQYCDTGFSSVVTGSGVDDGGGYTITSWTDTTLTLQYTSSDGHSHGVYTATLSNQFNASTGWAALVSQANTLVSGITLPALPASGGRTILVSPVSTGGVYTFDSNSTPALTLPPGTDPDTNIGGVRYGMVCACANGVGFYAAGYGLGGSGIPNFCTPFILVPLGTTIADYPGNHSGLVFPANCGYIVSAKSNWLISGKVAFANAAFPTINHNEIYAQAMTFSSGAPSFGSVISPGSFTTANHVTGNGTTYPDPFTFFKAQVSFLASDFATNTGGTYGMLGFYGTAW